MTVSGNNIAMGGKKFAMGGKHIAEGGKHITVDLLRHGEPEGGDILRGRVNPELTSRGWRQMEAAAERAGAHWTHLISSPLRRCRDFAHHLAGGRGLALQIDEQWQEIDYGDWDGMDITEWRKLAAPQFQSFREDLTALAPPNGETFLAFRDRVQGAWENLAGLPDGSHMLIVTHGGVMRVILPTVLGMPLNQSSPLHIPFACLSRVLLSIENGRSQTSLLFHNAGFPDKNQESPD